MARLHTPTNILNMRGSKRAKYGREKEPSVKVTTTLPPDYISESGKNYWDAIREEMDVMGVYSDADRLSLALLCDSLAEYLYARDMCDAMGAVLEDDKGKKYMNPWTTVKNKALDHITQTTKQFGFTPSARSHLTIGTPTGKVEDPLEKVMS